MNVILRRVQKKDVPWIVEYMSDPEIYEFLADDLPFPYTLYHAERFYSFAKDNFPFDCAIEVDGHFGGMIGLKEKKDIYKANLEIGYWLAKKFWGNGIMTEAITQITRTAFLEEGIVRVYADTFAENAASQKALANAKYRHEATLKQALLKRGELHDCVVYAILKSQNESF